MFTIFFRKSAISCVFNKMLIFAIFVSLVTMTFVFTLFVSFNTPLVVTGIEFKTKLITTNASLREVYLLYSFLL